MSLFPTTRRFQFRLATLFVVLTVAAVGAAAYGMYRRATLAEDEALKRIAAKGGWVLVYAEGAYIQFYAAPPAGPLTVDCGTGLVRTYSPAGSGAMFVDGDLALFRHVRRPLSVDFRNTSVTPAG